VLPPDAVVLTAHGAEIVAEVAPGENVRRVGDDAARGEVLRPAGARLRNQDAAAAAAAGLRACLVRQLSLRVVVPETEVGAAGACLIRSADPACRPVATLEPWTAEDWATALAEPLPDLVVVVGNRGPLLSGALAAAGRVLADGLALRSAEASLAGLIGPTPVIALPWRWDAALAALHCLVRPLIGHLTGAAAVAPTLRSALARKLSSSVGLTELALLRQTQSGLEPLAVGDLSLGALTQADAWLAVGPESEGYQAGELVEAYGL
jgi:molybdopterin biosynthesis enzyme